MFDLESTILRKDAISPSTIKLIKPIEALQLGQASVNRPDLCLKSEGFMLG